MPNRRDILALGAGSISLVLGPRHASAQRYPDRTVRLIVPSAAGAPDTVARIIAQQLQSQLKQSFIVENRPAANGTVGTEAVAKSSPDGYTLLAPSTAIVVNPSIYRSLPYDVMADLEPVTSLCRSDGYVLVINPSVPAQSLREFVALGRDPSNKLFYGSPGVGNALHLAAELFKRRTGVEMTHVPYRGTGPAITDLLGGRIHAMFITATLSLEHIKAGTMRPLAYTSGTRRPVLPEVPTMAEAGVNDFVMDGGWFGLFAPAKTPVDIVTRLYEGVKAALQTPEVQSQLAVVGLLPFESTPQEFKDFVREQIRFYSELVKFAGIEPQ